MPEFVIPADHPALPGHFPGHPVVPGVVILDRVIALWEAEASRPRVRGVDGVKFRQPLLPEQTARVRFQPAGEGRVKFAVEIDDGSLVSGQLLLADGN